MRKISMTAALAVACLTAVNSASATLIFQESFDISGATQAETTFTGRGNAGNIDFWQVLPNAPLNLAYTPTAIDGDYFWGGRDLNENFGGESGNNAQRFIDITNVDTSAYTNLSVTVALSARPGSTRFEANDFIEIFIDGVSFDTFTGAANGGAPLSNNTTDLGQEFQDFSYNVTDTDLLDIRVSAWNNGHGEAIAIDNIRINGTLVIPEPASLALIGLGLAGIGYRRHKIRILAT